MTPSMQVTLFDRLMVDDWEARITEVSKTGCTVDRTDGTNSPAFFRLRSFAIS
jgi:hypothetical protein